MMDGAKCDCDLAFVPLLRKKGCDAPTPGYEINLVNASQLLRDTEIFKHSRNNFQVLQHVCGNKKLDCVCYTNLYSIF